MFYVCSFIVSKLLKILSGWNRNRKKNWFYLCFSKKSDNFTKIAYFKTSKIGLTERLEIHTKKHLERCISINGAAGKNRTCDPVITNDVLYH